MYPRPTLSQLRAQAAADIQGSLPGADALLRFSNLNVLAAVLAALTNGNYGYLDWIAGQATPFTATAEYLEAWAALKNITRNAPTIASGSVQFTGTTGLSIPAGTSIVRGDGVLYTTGAAVTLAAGVATATITAVNAGSVANSAAATLFTLGTAIAGINSTGTATTAITGGTDAETDGSLRSRMLQAYAAAPQGGDLADYVTWALAVPGVTRAWNGGVVGGAGTVRVYFMMDVAESAFGGFPQGTNGVATNETRATAATGDQLAVANYIYPLRPVTALVYAYAPINNPVAFTITGTAAWSAPTKTAVQAAMAAVFTAQAAPGGVTDASGNVVGLVQLSAIEAAIAAVSGTGGFVITAMSCPNGTISASPDGNITANAGYLATLGTVTFS